ncbi:hypothetical protein F5B19DRAFT_475032 [Rostrohypoxylon terebratum]|nr:hypothetical protein F5B19DRAFT_475032 [Rostrohypoxylon terebratum]
MAFLRSVLSKFFSWVHGQTGEVYAWPEFDSIDDTTYLDKRDWCSDFYQTPTKHCYPSGTACCQGSDPFPSCVQGLGYGWCCWGNQTGQTCYIDIMSDCSSTNSAKCDNSGRSTNASLCCPHLTSCNTDDSMRGEGSLRCEIEYTDLMLLTATSSTSAVSTTSTGSSTEPQKVGYAMPSGVVAGIAVGAAGFITIVALAFYYLGRKGIGKQDSKNDNNKDSDNGNGDIPMKDRGQYGSRLSQDDTETRGHKNRLGIDSTEQPRELRHDRSPRELYGFHDGHVNEALYNPHVEGNE